MINFQRTFKIMQNMSEKKTYCLLWIISKTTKNTAALNMKYNRPLRQYHLNMFPFYVLESHYYYYNKIKKSQVLLARLFPLLTDRSLFAGLKNFRLTRFCFVFQCQVIFTIYQELKLSIKKEQSLQGTPGSCTAAKPILKCGFTVKFILELRHSYCYKCEAAAGWSVKRLAGDKLIQLF